MNKKIVIAGGCGFIGSYFKEQFKKLGFEVILISRKSNNTDTIAWADKGKIIEALEGSEMLINLAGKSVDCRYNEKNKAEIMSSRVESTKALGEALLQCQNPPPLWLNSSTATMYRYSLDKAMTESNGEVGTGFSVDVAKAWENAFYSFQLPNTRQVALRISIVLGDGGVMKPYVNLVHFGLGGTQGSGKQMFSWIHIDDLYNIVLFIQKNDSIKGAVNCASPNPVTNKTLMQTFRKVMHVKIGLPAYTWMLEIGTFFLRTESELILKSRWVIPEKLLQAGYAFRFPELEGALKDILETKESL